MCVGQRNSRSIGVLCSLAGYSRQSFYKGRAVIEREALQCDLVIQRVLELREQQKKVGGRKLYLHLQSFFKDHSISMGRDALFSLLARNSLLIRSRKRKTPVTTFSNHWMNKYPNLIIGFFATGAHQLLVGDITYIRIQKDDFAYLSLLTDAYSRKIVGYFLSVDLSAEGCVKALKMAIKQLPAGARAVHHSDRGAQYCCFDYVSLLKSHAIEISMTQSGDPKENAIAERVNGILKTELLEQPFPSFKEAQKAVAQSISVYNNVRLHSSVNMLTPAQAHNENGPLKRHWKSYYPEKEVVNVN
jgi:putative transposase